MVLMKISQCSLLRVNMDDENEKKKIIVQIIDYILTENTAH